MNEPNNYSTLAAMYWIGQTFTLFVIVMDGLAINEEYDHHQKDHTNSSTYDVNRGIEYYQYYIVVTVCIVECVSITASFVHVVFLCINQIHYESSNSCKSCLLHCFDVLCSPVFCCIKIKPREARLWLFLSGFIPPIIALSSHAGYIIGGWISYENRSIAIIIFFLFVFIYLFWSLQYAYLFSVALLHRIKQFCFERSVCRGGGGGYARLGSFIDDESDHESESSKHGSDGKKFGFDFTALLLMLPVVFVLDGIIVYVGFGAAQLPSLDFIDDVLNYYIFGHYIFIFVLFIFTYNLLSLINKEHHHMVTDRTFKFWRFLHRDSYHKHTITTLLHHAIAYI